MNILRATLLVLLALRVSADPIADVRSALGKLTAREAIKATYEVQQTVANEGKFDNDKFTGKAVVELEGDANGYRLVFPRPLLDQIDREKDAHSKDTKQSTPTVHALGQVDPVDTANAIDFAPVLMRMLDGAKLLSDTTGTFQGKTARVMVMRLVDRLDPEDAGRVKVSENKLTLWLGSDLVPVGAEHILDAKFSFLIFKGESKQKNSYYLAHVADRLVRVRHESSQKSSGMGQKGNESSLAIVRVH